jgi:signal transduction histidine kinase/AmiR/NasT family two-component response regulator
MEYNGKQQHSILVVENDQIIASDLKARLENMGYSVAGVASSSSEAMDILKAKAVDLVLMDIYLQSQMDGIQLAVEIGKKLSIPVVYLTAYSDQNTISEAKKTNPAAFVLKPYTDQKLKVTIELALHKHKNELELKEAKHKAESFQRQLEEVLKLTHTHIYIVDEKANLLYVDAEWKKQHGEYKGKKCFEYFKCEEEEQKMCRAFEVLKKRIPQNYETTIGFEKGRIFKAITLPYKDYADKWVAVQFLTDITDQKEQEVEKEKMEKTLRELQKLETLGVLAGGVAHDFNNLLMRIQGNTELALMHMPSGQADVKDFLSDVVAACQQAASITEQLLAYAGKGVYLVEGINLSEVVREMVPLVATAAGRRTKLELKLSDELPLIIADTIQIRQLCMNLLLNAIEAIEEGAGVVVVETGTIICDENYIPSPIASRDFKPGTYCMLKISDTGRGIEPNILPHIFDPFFSTKSAGRGIGLSAVLGIVRSHKGDIKIESVPQKGTTVEVLLPAVG